MAMLAEPRRKKRYNLVPKGKPLFEDGNRFGTKMLEKMGWSKGKGLGSRENGHQDFVRIRYKNDVDGLGFVERDDQWTEHEKHFNGFLDTLNGENSTSTNASDECKDAAPTFGFGFKSKSVGKEKLTDKFSGQSLEEISKNSKARVHYKKFTKGKDMAQYSEKDLANIFGKKDSTDDNIYSQFQAFNAGENKEDTVPLESGTNIIYTGMSVTDYFKLKMEAKKGLPLGNGVDNMEDEQPLKKKKKNKKPSSEENPESTQNPANELGTQIINTGVSVNDYFKAKMEALKQKNGLPVDNNIESEENCVAAIESDNFPTQEATMKKQKKSKKQPVDEVLAEDSSVVEESEVSPKNKKKKTKTSTVIQNELDSSTVETLSVGLFEDGIPLKKKKSKKRSAQEVAATDDTQSLTNIPKKMKIETSEEPGADSPEIPKKKKKKQSDSVQSTVTETLDEVESSQLEEETLPKEKTPLTKNLHKERNETLPSVPSANGITSKKKKNKKPSAVEKPAELPEATEVPKKKKKNKQENSAEPPSKKKTNITNSNATIPTEVSSQHELIPLKADYLLDTYTISTFCAEKFRNIELQKFHASSISQINGYGLSENLELNIKEVKNDQQRIMRLWSGTLDKYQHATPKNKIYSNYMTKAKKARRAQNKIPQIHVKCLKRKNVFQCL